MVRNGVALLLLVLVAACDVRGQGGFALLLYPQAPNTNDGNYKNWRPLTQSSPPAGWVEGDPFTLTYGIDTNIFPSMDAVERTAVFDAIESALQTWSDATNGHMTFAPSQWIPVAAQIAPAQSNFCFIDAPATQWEGPGIRTGDWGNHSHLRPGRGGNIEFFSMPEGCTIQLPNSQVFVMSSGILGFAAFSTSGDFITTVDIILNESKSWTTDGAAAMASMAAARSVDGVFSIPYGCSCDGHGVDGHVHRASSRMAFDVETVVLHELGHALGLGHPDEAASNNGNTFDPFDFSVQDPPVIDSAAVMHGSYTVVKRELRDEEFGGLAALYKPSLAGDLDASGDVTILDAAAALDAVSGGYPSTAWDVNLLDFMDRNGVVDLKEASQVMLWALRPDEFPTGMLVGKGLGGCLGTQTTVDVRAVVTPEDVGLGGPIRVEIQVDNPDQVPFSGWDLDIAYDPVVFSNPVLIEGDFLPDGMFTSLGPDDGELMFSKISFNDDDSLCGVLGTIEFDVDIAAAVASPSVEFELKNGILVATCPGVHNYGDDAMETLIITDGDAIAWDYDVNLDLTVDLEDWYAFGQTAIDVDQDSDIDSDDWEAMGYGLRMGEAEDVLGVPR